MVLLFALNRPDKDVPEEYKDLLPIPWEQIEARLKQGETVEAAGEARERHIVLLAAPTAPQFEKLMHHTKYLPANPQDK